MLQAASFGSDIFRAVLQGAPPGAVYALIALGFVLAFKTSGVFNLAFGAQAYISSLVFFKLNVGSKWGIIPSFVVAVVVVAPLLGFLLEWLIFRHLRTAPAAAKLVMTIGLSVALPAIVELFINVKDLANKRPPGLMPRGNDVFYDVFNTYKFSRNEVASLVVALIAVLGLGALFKFSAIGLRMRAVVESPRLTELNAIAADRVSAFAWALSSLFAGLAGVLISPKFTGVKMNDYFNIVIVAVAAAAIGKLSSLPRALVGGLGLGMFIALFNTFLPKWAVKHTWLQPIEDNVTPSIPFLVLFGMLVFTPAIRRSREAGDPLAGVDPPPMNVSAIATGQRPIVAKLVELILPALILLVVFTRGDSVWLFLVTQAVAMGVIALSITVITGMAGQISLGQGAFAAMGAFAAFQLAKRGGTSTLVGMLVGALIAAAVAALLSLPIRKLNGVWIAIATLAFAFFFDSVMVKFSWVGGSSAGTMKVPRPAIGPIDFGNDKSFLALCVVILIAVALAVIALGKGTFGQQLKALRGSEVASQAIGISPGRVRMVAFAVSAFIAAIGGALMAMAQKNVNYELNFAPFVVLFWLVLVVTLGVRTVGGAITAGAAFFLANKVLLDGTLFTWLLRGADNVPDWLVRPKGKKGGVSLFPLAPSWRFILFGLATIQFARHPEGAVEHSRRKKAAKKQAKLAAQGAAAAAALEAVAP